MNSCQENLKEQSHEESESFGIRLFKYIASRLYLRCQSIFSSSYINKYFSTWVDSTTVKNEINEYSFNEENCKIQSHELNFNYIGQSGVLLQTEPKEDLYFEFINHSNTFLGGLFSNSCVKSNVLDKCIDRGTNSLAEAVSDENETINRKRWNQFINCNNIVSNAKTGANSYLYSKYGSETSSPIIEKSHLYSENAVCSCNFVIPPSSNNRLFSEKKEIEIKNFGDIRNWFREKNTDELSLKISDDSKDMNMDICSSDEFDIFIEHSLQIQCLNKMKDRNNCKNLEQHNIFERSSKNFENQIKNLIKRFIFNLCNLKLSYNQKLSNNILTTTIGNKNYIRKYIENRLNSGKAFDFYIVADYLGKHLKTENRFVKYILWFLLGRKIFSEIETSTTNLMKIHSLLFIKINIQLSQKKKQHKMHKSTCKKPTYENLGSISNTNTLDSGERNYIKTNNISAGITAINKIKYEIKNCSSDFSKDKDILNELCSVKKYDKIINESNITSDSKNIRGSNKLPTSQLFTKNFILDSSNFESDYLMDLEKLQEKEYENTNSIPVSLKNQKNLNQSKIRAKYDEPISECTPTLDNKSCSNIFKSTRCSNEHPNFEYFMENPVDSVLKNVDENENCIQIEMMNENSFDSLKLDKKLINADMCESKNGTKRKREYKFYTHRKKTKMSDTSELSKFKVSEIIQVNGNEAANDFLDPPEIEVNFNNLDIEKNDKGSIVLDISSGYQSFVNLNAKASNTQQNSKCSTKYPAEKIVRTANKKNNIADSKTLFASSFVSSDREMDLNKINNFESKKISKFEQGYSFDSSGKMSENRKCPRLPKSGHLSNIKKKDHFYNPCSNTELRQDIITAQKDKIGHYKEIEKSKPLNIIKNKKYNNAKITHQGVSKEDENLVLRNGKQKLKFDLELASKNLTNDMKPCAVLLNKQQLVSQDTCSNLSKTHFESVEYASETFEDFLKSSKSQVNNINRAIKACLPPNFEDFINSSKEKQSTVFASTENKMINNTSEVTTTKFLVHSINYKGSSKFVKRNTPKQRKIQNSNLKSTQTVNVNSKSDISRHHRIKRKLVENNTSLNEIEADEKSSKRAKILKVNPNSPNRTNSDKYRGKITDSNSCLALSSHLDTLPANEENYLLMYRENYEAPYNSRLKLSTLKSERYHSVTVGKKLTKKHESLEKSAAQSQRAMQINIKDFHSFQFYSHSNNKNLNECWETAARPYTFKKKTSLQISPNHKKHRLYTLKNGELEMATIDDLLLKSKRKSIKEKNTTC